MLWWRWGWAQLLGQGSSLAVTAAYQPARRRIQQTVDRRFNRRRYDSAQTMAAFSVRLRDHTDLDTLTSEVLGVVDQTIQPTRAWLWLKLPSNTVGRTGQSR